MLEAENINIFYGDQKILENVSLKISKGERVALLGPSGAGKSSLLRVLAGIQIPKSGNVSFDQIKPQYENKESSFSSARKWIWPGVTLVFQDLQLFPNLTGFENCSDSLKNLEGHQLSEVTRLASLLGVQQCMNKIPKKMSQGEQQRVSIVRALAKQPKVLLMDEPTSAIDPIAKGQLVSLIIEESVSRQMSMLIATHDWEFANKFANKFVVIKNGKVNLFNNIREATNEMSGVN